MDQFSFRILGPSWYFWHCIQIVLSREVFSTAIHFQEHVVFGHQLQHQVDLFTAKLTLQAEFPLIPHKLQIDNCAWNGMNIMHPSVIIYNNNNNPQNTWTLLQKHSKNIYYNPTPPPTTNNQFCQQIVYTQPSKPHKLWGWNFCRKTSLMLSIKYWWKELSRAVDKNRRRPELYF